MRVDRHRECGSSPSRAMRCVVLVLAAALACDGFVLVSLGRRGRTRQATLNAESTEGLVALAAPENNLGACEASQTLHLMLLRCTYIPGSTASLNFIEPRLRQMCQTTEQFLVSFVPGDVPSQFCSRVCVVFEL